MDSRVAVGVLLLGLLGIANSYGVKRSVNDDCQKLADAVDDYIDHFGEENRCLISEITSSMVGLDLADRDVIKEIFCLVLENKATGADIFRALDNAGYIDKLLEVIYSYLAITSQLGITDMVREGVTDELLNQCHPNMRPSPYRTFAELSSEDFYRLYDTIDELQLFSLSPEVTRDMWRIMEMTALFNINVKHFPLVPAARPGSGITDPDLRCEKMNAATKPFYKAMEAKDQLRSELQRANSQMQLFTGVDLLSSNFSAGAQRISCEIGKLTSVGDFRSMLEDSGLLNVGFDLMLGMSCLAFQGARSSYQYMLDREENPEQNGHYWKPSKSQIARNKLMIAIADVWSEVGLDAVEVNVPMVPQGMIQACRNPSSGPTPRSTW